MGEEAANGYADSPDLIPTFRVKEISTTTVGKGQSVSVDFDMAPKDKWLRRDDEAVTSEEAETDAAPDANADDDNWQQ